MTNTHSTGIPVAAIAAIEASTRSSALQVVFVDGTAPLAVDIPEQCVSRFLPEVSSPAEAADFPEAHEDPAQSEELERQQDA
jgi:hypothetical protein